MKVGDKNVKKFLVFLASSVMILFLFVVISGCKEKRSISAQATKLHWFIPDGMRADPELFDIFKWAKEGKLPNIKKLMERGSYGYSIPTFPTHTPTNFATLLTGTYPEIHGVADGPMHIEGYPLTKPSVAGFSSVAKKVPTIWSFLEEQGKGIVLLSVPGSTPPELKYNGITIRGRWGGWGADFHSLIFEKKSKTQRKKLARGSRLFFLGYELTRFVDIADFSDWELATFSFSKPLDLELNVHGAKIYARIIDTTDDKVSNYDKVIFSKGKNKQKISLSQGQWSPWVPVIFKWGEKDVPSSLRINVIKLDEDGFFRIRLVVNNLNKYIVEPSSVADELLEDVGPMVDFVDNFPPQLIYYDEDRKAFLEEANLSFNWHKKAISAIYERYKPDVFINDIYTPNQMLTSRWWLGYVDPASKRYNDVSSQEREKIWKEVLSMYKHLDDIVGEIIKNTDKDTLIVLSSDHGAAPLDKWVKLNNFFASKGWLSYEINIQTGEPIINWENTKVIYLKMDSIYINPNGLGGNWYRGSGQEYEKLRDEVMASLKELEDDEGFKPVSGIFKWEDVKEFLDLPADRVGDLVIANYPGYGWNEELSEEGKIFSTPLKTGYKQAIFAKETKAMWTPFIVVGPGIKKNYRIKDPIKMVDQFSIIMKSMGLAIPDHAQGDTIDEIYE